MSLLNLSLPELIALFSTVSAVLVTLYLLDRSRRRQVVATLKFWTPAESAQSMRQKRRIQQPWSLLLQLLSIILLLLAIAQLQWGDRAFSSHDHVLILDTSAWMGARSANGTLMDDARTAALAYVHAVPSADRVMIVRADALATPVTPFDSSRAALDRSIRESKPTAAALNLDQALEFADRVQKLHSSHPGEIVYIGAGRIPASDGIATPPTNLRVIPIGSPSENCGLRKIGLNRVDAETWQVFVSARNYGTARCVAPLAMQFGGAPMGSRTLTLDPGVQRDTSFMLRTRAAGLLEIRLLTTDAFPEDDRAVVEVPAQPALKVIVFSTEPELLRPLLASNPNVTPLFRTPAAYDPKLQADAVVFDGFAPAVRPTIPSIWIDPPAQRSPVRIRTTAQSAKLVGWNSDSELGTGLHTRDVEFDTASVFAPAAGDISIASVAAGPVILARAGSPKLVVFGFHPARSAMQYELATPLLFANILRWINPAVFQRWELNAGSVGTIEERLERNTNPNDVKVSSDDGRAVPFTVENDHLRFFASAPGTYRAQAGDREIGYSLMLPDVGDSQWTIPAGVRRGLPRVSRVRASVADLWPWLALAGAAGLLLEWFLYGRGRREAWGARRKVQTRSRVLQRKAS